MKKYKYGDGSIDPFDYGNQLHEEVLNACKSIQENALVSLMERKGMEVCDRLNFGTYAERLMFLDAFYKGYIAAHCYNEHEEKLIMKLSPLGQALK